MTLIYPLPIPDGALDVSFPAPQYENDFASIVGNAGTDSDGFESLFLDASQILVDAPAFLAGLDVALNGIFTAYPGVNQVWEQDFSDTLSGAISQGDGDFNQFSVDLTGNTPPPPGGQPGSGGTPTPITQSANCGTHGQSSILLSDAVGNCFFADALPIANIPDGACTKIYLMNNSTGAGTANVSATALQSGDAQLFSITHDTVANPSGGAAISRVLIKLSPYKTGHFLGKFSVTTNRQSTPEIWCMLADVIDTGGTAGGGGGGTGSGGGTPIGGGGKKTTV